MKYIKMLGLLAVAAAALMAFVGTASATVTAGGSTYNGPIKATSTNSKLTGSLEIACKKSTVEGSVVNGATTGTVSSLTFEECGNDTVTAIGNAKEPHHCGHLTIHSNGDITSTGCQVTVLTHRTVFGFPVTTHCIYKTENTTVGTLTENVAPAVMHIGESKIPQVVTDGACGENAIWTGTYTVNTPSSAIVVH